MWNVNNTERSFSAGNTQELIETLWNVNKKDTVAKLAAALRINRNIVECKSYKQGLKDAEGNGINRNIVECKFFLTSQSRFLRSRINRNIVECKYINAKRDIANDYELIETLWNVNFSRIQENNLRCRINRNIVECK